MRRRLHIVSLVLMLALSLGWHWTALQSFAWARMFFTYSQQAPFSEALKKTFDGENPCTVCKLVQEGKKSEQEHPTSHTIGKVDLFLDCSDLVLYAPDMPEPSFALIHFRQESAPSPPIPPPRSV